MPKVSRKAQSVKSEGRTRNWTFILYPDSAPANWREIVNSWHVEAAASPLHDADQNGDGSEKKQHWHVAVFFDGPKSYEQICAMIEPLHCTIPVRVASMRSLIRYFVHLDNPDKHQYSVEDIISFGGFDVDAALDLTGALLRQAVADMTRYILVQGFTEFADFAEYCLLNNMEWFNVLTDKRTVYFRTLLASMRGRPRSTPAADERAQRACFDAAEKRRSLGSGAKPQ